MTTENVPNLNDPEQVCILWHSAEKPPAETLIRALSHRGLAVMPTESLHTVFAAACRCSKSSKRVVIVLEDQDSLVGVDRVLDGLERFSPSVIFWEHREGMNPPMVPVVRTMTQSNGGSQSQIESIDEGSPSTGKLRLVNDEDTLGRKQSVGISKDGPINTRDVLDADELDALLAGEMGKGPRGK
jgi:hypothetical protein